MDFLTPGQKIRKLRKQFGLRQHDLQDEHMTRNFISMVEKNKRGLSAENAGRLAEKFNRIAEEQNINIDIDGKYFLVSVQEQAEEYCQKLLENTKVIIDVEEIIGIAKKYSLKRELAKAYLLKGNFLYTHENYADAFINYNEALNIYINLHNNMYQAYLYNRLGKCKLKEMDFVEALLYFTRAESLGDINNEKSLIIDSNYNIALCYRELGKQEQAIEYLSKYSYDDFQEFEKYIYFNILRAECYKDKKKYDSAVNIYFELMEKIKDNNLNIYFGLIHNNIGEIYIDKGHTYEALKYLDNAEEMMDEENTNLDLIYINKGKAYIEQEKYQKALNALEKGIKISKKNNKVENLISAYYLLADVYKVLDDYIDYEDIYLKILKLLKSINNNEQEVLKISIDLALINMEIGREKKAEKYLRNAIE